MTKQFKYIITVICTLFLFYGCGNNLEARATAHELLGEELDSLSFDELKQNVLDTYAQYGLFHAFFSNKDSEPEDYEKEKEKNEAPFKLGTTYLKSHFEKGISFSQSLAYPNSKLEISSEIRERDGEGITYFLDRIYYNDGSSDSIDRSISRSFISDIRKIDSVRVTVRYRYATDIERIELSKSNNSVSYKGGTIKLKDLDKNYAQYVMSDTISGPYITTQALTKFGNIVGTNSTTSGSMPPERQAKKFDAIQKGLKAIATKVTDDKYKTKEDLIADIYKAAASFQLEDTNEYYRSEYFYGNIETLYLYFAKNRTKEDYVFTFPVTSFIEKYNLVNDDKTKLWGVVGADGKFVIKPKYKNLEQVNSNYFTVQDYYNDLVLYFNEEGNRLDTLKTYKLRNIGELTSELAVLTYRNKMGALGKSGKLVIPLEYDNIKTDEGKRVIIATKEKTYTLFDSEGNMLFSSTGRVGEFTDGIAVCSDIEGNKTWMIDILGRKVLSVNQYESVLPFSDGLATVSKNGKYGFIRKDGSVAIPFMYDDAKEFSYGVTLVSLDGEYGLINTENKFIVPLRKTGGYSISTNFGKRSYYMGGRTYNEIGELEKDKDEDDDF